MGSVITAFISFEIRMYGSITDLLKWFSPINLFIF
jgi:hypothetical protein